MKDFIVFYCVAIGFIAATLVAYVDVSLLTPIATSSLSYEARVSICVLELVVTLGAAWTAVFTLQYNAFKEGGYLEA